MTKGADCSEEVVGNAGKLVIFGNSGGAGDKVNSNGVTDSAHTGPAPHDIHWISLIFQTICESMIKRARKWVQLYHPKKVLLDKL